MSSYLGDGILAVAFDGTVDAETKVESLREYFHGFGYWAPVVYIALVTFEVFFAPIPGALLYAPGGFLFGGFWGGLLSLIGNTLGAGLACSFVRLFGADKLNRFFQTRHPQMEQMLHDRGVWCIFLLRLNPLTSSDLVSFAAGFTRMPVWQVMMGTMLGMAPLCWVQAYLAHELLSAMPELLLPFLLACGIYAFVVIWLLFGSAPVMWSEDAVFPDARKKSILDGE
ncbi:MAG: TVP38/TMEM64 family protein [Gemmatales bacterium]|nr:MAG: TVP38/TMEM64 family protein [Gemmatales bacterium]